MAYNSSARGMKDAPTQATAAAMVGDVVMLGSGSAVSQSARGIVSSVEIANVARRSHDFARRMYSIQADSETHTSKAPTNGTRMHTEGSDVESDYSSDQPRRIRSRQAAEHQGFVCPDCGKAFDRRSDLSKHQKYHLPEKQRPYVCLACSKRFLYPKDLRRHELAKHARTPTDSSTILTKESNDLPTPLPAHDQSSLSIRTLDNLQSPRTVHPNRATEAKAYGQRPKLDREVRAGETLSQPQEAFQTIIQQQSDVNVSDNYAYSELDDFNEFRLLTILGDHDGILWCRISRHTLPSKNSDVSNVEYDAITWLWGSGNEVHSCFVVGEDGEGRTMSVRRSLLGALRSVAVVGSTKKFWIDALCIDQNNVAERACQVQHMPEIFANAQNVCVYVGEHENDSEKALEFIQYRVCDIGAYESTVEDQHTQKEWKAVAALMNRSIFSRRWTVQELALARTATIHCGEDYISWDNFETAVALFERDAQRLSLLYRASASSAFDSDFFGDVSSMRAVRLVHTINDLFRKDDHGRIIEYRYTLMDLVGDFIHFETSDPRDSIYSIVPLAKDAHRATRAFTPRFNTMNSPNVTQTDDHSHLVQPYNYHNTLTSSLPEQSPTLRSTGTNTRKRKGENSCELDDSNERPGRAGNIWKRLKKPVLLSARPSHFFPPIDYGQRPFELYRQFLEFTIPRQPFPNLDILCRPWAPEDWSGELKLPSWISQVKEAAFSTRFSSHAPGGVQMKRKTADPLVGQTARRLHSYNACRSIRTEHVDWRFGSVDRGESEYSLFVTGFVLDEIGVLEDASQLGNIPADWLRLGGWKPWNEKGEHDSNNRPPEPLWRTLIGDRGPDGSNAKVYYRQAVEYALTTSTHEVGLQTTELKQRMNPILSELLDRVEAVVWDRRLFRSGRDNNLGLAPKRAREGDYICILKGCSVPVVLRKDRDGTHFTFIGECYLHTMMDGQAIDKQAEQLERLRRERGESGRISAEEKLIQLQTFELR